MFALAAVAPQVSRGLGRAGGWVLAIAPLMVAGVLLSYVPRVSSGEVIRESVAWAPELGLTISVALDGLGLMFALLISGMGALIFVYAQGYLGGHRHLPRIYAYLLIFMGAMLGVVLSDNLLVMFVFWELTSISSYLLIGFDNNRVAARKAALQALLVTGGGGLALLVGILLLWKVGGSLDVSVLAGRGEVIKESGLYTAIVLLFALGAFTKSAQFPFHFWLPGAMEAPTPVSAYLHSATMVKAGIFLLARMSPVLGGSELWTTLLTLTGATTAVLGAVLAFRQTYLKKILAYSTVSSLGLLVMMLGIGTSAAVEAAMAYLLAHAIFKGGLFMVAGAIDHGTGQRDAEKLGGLFGAMPLLGVVSILAACSMIGLPPMFGFVGKELVLKSVGTAPVWSEWLTAVMMVAAVLGAAAAILAGIKPFVGKRVRTPHEPHAPGLALVLGPCVLAVLGVAVAVLPLVLSGPLVGPAASAVLGLPSEPDLHLWHGWTKELALSAAAVGIGVVAFALRRGVRRIIEVLGFFDRVGPEHAYGVGLKWLNAVAKGQTRLLQNGYLRSYLMVTMGTASGLVAYTLWSRGGLILQGVSLDVRWYELMVGLLIAVAAIAAAVAKNRLMTIAALGLAGYGVSVMFVMFGAPDLAMTQIAIETLTVILFALLFRRLPDFRSISKRSQKVRDMFVAGLAGAMMTVLILVASRVQIGSGNSSWFGEQSYVGGHGRNVVNVILVDFRAIDTLGEITVLAVAAIGVFALLRPGRKQPEQKESER